MANLGFFIDKHKINKKGQAPILLQFDFDKKRLKLSTGEKIETTGWSTSKQRAKPSYNSSVSLNNYLDVLEKNILEIYRDLKSDGKVPSPDAIKNKFYESINKKKTDFFSLYDNYLIQSKKTKTHSTIRSYTNTLFYLKEYKKDTKFSFGFDDITIHFYRKFVDYLIDKKELSNNTIGRIIKILKSFLNWATENNYNRNLEFKKFKVFKEEIEIVYLTKEELAKIYLKELPTKALERTRDVFCFACYTGLRFSDIAKINPNDIKEDELYVRTKKTKDQIVIPLLDNAKMILEKYDNELPVISNQKINTNLKEICKEAELEEIITINRYRGSEVINQKIPKYKLVTTHTARRTFITLSLEFGLRPEIVMSITGHKDYRTMKPYIKIVDKVKKNEFLKAWN